jgi:hypothetical protein
MRWRGVLEEKATEQGGPSKFRINVKPPLPAVINVLICTT